MSKRQMPPTVTIKSKRTNNRSSCFITVHAGRFWQYELDYDENILIVFIGDSEWEYEIPRWVTEACDVVETDRSLEVTCNET